MRPPESVTVTRSPTCTFCSDDSYVDTRDNPSPAIPIPSTISLFAPGLRNDPCNIALGVANVGNGGSGIHILNGSNNLIGQALSVPPNSQSVSTPPSDTPAVPGNTIAFNGAAGVAIDSGLDNAIHQNSIFNVNTLGILLGQGANHNQGAPNLLSAHQLSNSVQVSGTLNYLPNSVYTLEFYASQGSGTIGRTPIGYQAVRTNAAGFAAFSFYGSKPPAGETFITATATDVDQNTSEFSNYVSSVT